MSETVFLYIVSFLFEGGFKRFLVFELISRRGLYSKSIKSLTSKAVSVAINHKPHVERCLKPCELNVLFSWLDRVFREQHTVAKRNSFSL